MQLLGRLGEGFYAAQASRQRSPGNGTRAGGLAGASAGPRVCHMEQRLASLPQTPWVQTPCARAAQLTQEQLALLGDSDSEVEIEEVAVPAQIGERPAAYKTATAKISEGPVGRYSSETLSATDPTTLLRDAMLVDNPQACCGSFKRLRKKTRVGVLKKVGRALQQLTKNTLTGGADRAAELWAEARHGSTGAQRLVHSKSVWTRLKSNGKRNALRCALRRLCEGSYRKPSNSAVNLEVSRVLEACPDESSQAQAGLFLLAAAQPHMYSHRGCKVSRLPLPSGQTFESNSQLKTSLVKPAPGFMCTLWTCLHEEPEVQTVILAAKSDNELVRALEHCSKVRLFFAQYVDRLRRGVGRASVDWLVALEAKWRSWEAGAARCYQTSFHCKGLDHVIL